MLLGLAQPGHEELAAHGPQVVAEEDVPQGVELVLEDAGEEFTRP